MNATAPTQETTMRDHPPALRLWLRCGLAKQFTSTLAEPVPQDMLDLLSDYSGPN